MEEPTGAQPPSTYEKPYKMDPNVEAALSYIPLVGVAVYLMEKSNKFVRFHAMQSILFWVAIVVLNSVASAFRIFIIGYVLLPIVSILAVGGWVLLSWKAYNNEEFLVPIIGKTAKDLSDK
ncbi:MAG: DUF4870 domain-containing protein [Patescibacteria group bacterium]|jgi:uncharacterized membrane protein